MKSLLAGWVETNSRNDVGGLSCHVMGLCYYEGASIGMRECIGLFNSCGNYNLNKFAVTKISKINKIIINNLVKL